MPVLGGTGSGGIGEVAHEILTSTTLRYDDGPHDAEAVVVDPTDGSVFVINKEARGPSKVFVADGETLRIVGSITLDEGGFLLPNRITGADALADGSGLVFRTYQSGYLLRRAKGEAWRSAFGAKPEASLSRRRFKGNQYVHV